MPFHAEEKHLSTRLEGLRQDLQAPSARLLDISSVQTHVQRKEDSMNNISDEDLTPVLVVSNISFTGVMSDYGTIFLLFLLFVNILPIK